MARRSRFASNLRAARTVRPSAPSTPAPRARPRKSPPASAVCTSPTSTANKRFPCTSSLAKSLPRLQFGQELPRLGQSRHAERQLDRPLRLRAALDPPPLDERLHGQRVRAFAQCRGGLKAQILMG